MSTQISEKKKFFDELTALHDGTESDDEFEDFRIPPAPVAAKGPKKPETRRRPVPNPSTTARSTKVVPTVAVNPVKVSKKNPKPSPSVLNPPTSRNKLFSGLNFYFVPNNKKSVIRKKRIQTCEDGGAVCIFGEFKLDVITHVIVDPGYDYNKLLQILKLENIPDKINIVNEDYTVMCLHHGRLLDPSQEQYRIAGHNEPSKQEPPGGIISIKQTHKETNILNIIATKKSAHKSTEKNAEDIQSEALVEILAPTTHKDDLEAVIADAKLMPYLDDDEMPEDGHGEYNSDEEQRRERQKKRKGKGGLEFKCLSKNDDTQKGQKNPNKRTIEFLSQLQDYYERVKDQWRSYAYRRAITTLKNQTTRISFADEAMRLPHVGERIANKIEEIVRTDQLKRLEYANLEPTDEIIKLFVGIYGVGLAQAREWVAEGHKTLEDLKKKAKLSESQKIGIDHYESFNTRMKRDEVRKHGEIVIKTAHEIDSSLELEIMGSYRRGAATCGDIDIMVTKKDAEGHELESILNVLTTKLFEINFLKCGLATPRGKGDGSKWHGASALCKDGPWRRIVPWEERGAALIYFTGNDIFNRSIRLLASKKGYRLNQRGLYKNVLRGAKRQRITEGELVEGVSEKRIFEILKVPYRAPRDRNC